MRINTKSNFRGDAPKFEKPCVLQGESLVALTRTLAFVSLIVFAGCGSHVPEFKDNELFILRIEKESGGTLGTAREDVRACLNSLFGTPDNPKSPEALDGSWRLDMEKVGRAAGAVGRAQDGVERGLWRKHCATCHGISGDGAGPTAALQAPYTRDFRRGSFKFKSTPIGSRPTHADFVRIIENGIQGTAMPGFQSLTRTKFFEKDIDALAEYVMYLSIRGEVERKLLTQAGLELDDSEGVFDASLGASDPRYESQQKRIQAVVSEVLQPWSFAETKVTPVSVTLPNDLQSSIERGKQLFNSETTACASCHGPEGKGNGKSQDFDEWTKDWTIRAGIDPLKREEWKPMKKLGALKPVKNPPRNFHLGAFRGGSNPSDIYLRIVNGIEGTPMPAVAKQPENRQGLTEPQIWDVVNFVLSLNDNSARNEEAK